MDHNARKKKIDRELLHKDPMTRRWRCNLCNLDFSRKVYSVDHVEEQHLKIPAYPCQYCDKLLVSTGQRRKHIFYTHRDENRMAKQYKQEYEDSLTADFDD